MGSSSAWCNNLYSWIPDLVIVTNTMGTLCYNITVYKAECVWQQPVNKIVPIKSHWYDVIQTVDMMFAGKDCV